MNHNKVNK